MTDQTTRNPPAGPDDKTIARARALLSAYLEEAEQSGDTWNLDPKDYGYGRTVLNETDGFQAAVVRESFERCVFSVHQHGSEQAQHQERALDALLRKLLQYPLPLRDEDIFYLLNLFSRLTHDSKIYDLLDRQRNAVLGQITQYVEDYGFPPGCVPLLTRMVEAKQLAEMPGKDCSTLLVKGTPWGTTALDALEKMAASEREAWTRLLGHARKARLAAPSIRWRERAKERLAEVGEAAFEQRMREWFALIEARANAPLMDRNSTLLRGLIWMCGLLDSPGMAGALASIAGIGYKKLPRSPILSGVMGDAAICALGLLPGDEAAAQLGRLRLRLKHESAQDAIEKALNSVAGRAGVAANEIAELLVPTFDMEAPGLLRETWGEFSVTVTFSGMGSPQWMWFGKGGKPQKSVPAQVKKEYAGDWKRLKETAADLQKILTAQRDRIEKLLLLEREWDIPTWQARYLNHPLLALVTQRLLWEFRDDGIVQTGLWRDGRFEDAAGQALREPTNTTRVRLWHPLHHDPEVVLRWRKRLEQLEITQPFKQAHREVYLLTDAEQRTATYSNRFAAHLLKHYQFHALCQSRGWQYTLPRFDSSGKHAVPTVELPHYGLSAQLWVEPLGHGEWSEYGVPLYLETDQVRFCGQGREPLPLETIPPVVFSEVMRDVDLFVGVASVGNDPEWRNNATDDTHREYWNSYSFGDLSVSGQTRRDVIARLLPRLRIASRCEISSRFLVVRGDLRTYKIHLGSGNILMEPNSQYLCIVPDRNANEKDNKGSVFLPFEGDRTLSLILSKAFLLAEDFRITDATIVSQIQHR